MESNIKMESNIIRIEYNNPIYKNFSDRMMEFVKIIDSPGNTIKVEYLYTNGDLLICRYKPEYFIDYHIREIWLENNFIVIKTKDNFDENNFKEILTLN